MTNRAKNQRMHTAPYHLFENANSYDDEHIALATKKNNHTNKNSLKTCLDFKGTKDPTNMTSTVGIGVPTSSKEKEVNFMILRGQGVEESNIKKTDQTLYV